MDRGRPPHDPAPPPPSSRLDAVAMVVLFVLTCGVRLALIAAAPASWSGDETDYVALGVRLDNGLGFSRVPTAECPIAVPRCEGQVDWRESTTAPGVPTARRTPLLPAFVALVLPLSGADPRALRGVLAVTASLAVPALYLLVRWVGGSRGGGLLAAGALAASTNGHRLATLVYPEALAAFLLVMATLLTVRAESSRSAGLGSMAGLLLGLAVLARAFLLPAIAGPAIWLYLRRARRAALALLATAALIPGLWIARNAVAVDAWALTTETDALWQGNNRWARGSWPGEWSEQERYLRERHPDFAGLGEGARSRLYVRETVHDVLADPRRILWLLPRKALVFFSPVSYLGLDVAYLAVLPLAALGTWRLGGSRMRLLLLLVGWPILAVLAVCLLAFGDPRFRHPVDPFICVLAAFGTFACQPVGRDPP
ncbi:MAG TPA: glycosyltransferase family 39 protein [Vicinamibacteria bacterium]|nr:glycosyltransferase family 39 protein [Vicinamibacteria bacterium]